MECRRMDLLDLLELGARRCSRARQRRTTTKGNTNQRTEHGWKEKIMGLMERVATLLRANVNDLIDRAEDPEKMLKQLLTDMENQLLQGKTQGAIAIGDQHLLEKKALEQRETADGWRRKAELAVEKNEDELARLALERALGHDGLAEGFAR